MIQYHTTSLVWLCTTIKKWKFLTQLCLLQIENNMISEEYVGYMKEIAVAVDKLERIANG